MLSLCVVKKKKKKSNEQINEELPLSEGPKMALFFFSIKIVVVYCVFISRIWQTPHT